MMEMCILNQWVKPIPGEGKWELTRKGQTLRLILNELYNKGKVARLENPNLYKKTATENLAELILLLMGRIRKFD